MHEIDEFLNYLTVYNRSKKTIRDYKLILEDFNQNINKSYAEITSKDILAYITQLSDKGYRPTTINKRIACLKSFFKYLRDSGQVKDDVTAIVKSLKIPKRNPDYLSVDDFNNVMGNMWSRNKARNKVILALGAICGLRVSEIVNVNIDDINGDELRVVGKGDKERFIRLSNTVIDLIYEYLDERESENNALLLSENGERISVRSVQHIIERLSEKTGIKFHAHTLRHTAATLSYQETKDLAAVQEMLGHENVNTTRIYTHVLADSAKAAVESNPLNKSLSK